ncbi:MAG TPA: TonB-dependent receptor [Terriglobia bacterium]|nr:TonB-dependent receptor [Terriglobia bacterium]
MNARTKSMMARYLALNATLCSLLLWLSSGVVAAQDATGQLQVEVFGVDSTGERYYVPGAKVVVTPELGSPDTKKTPSASSESLADANGKAVLSLPCGCYQVAATAEGLKGQGDRICLTTSSTAVNLAVEMKLDVVVKETLEVSATQEGLETTESSASGTVESSTLEHAPNANERFEGLLPLLPGVVRGPDGLINMKGARATQNGALVNSANVTDPAMGTSAINLPIDVVSSVQVLSNPYDSEYGKFAGAISTVTTKGSDLEKFHGSFQNFTPRPKERDGNIMGIGAFTPRVTLSTPLINGRVGVMQSLEYRYVRTELTGTGLPPLHRDTGLESFDSFTRLDFKINDRHTAAFNLSFYPQKLEYVGLNTFTPQPSTPDLHQRGYMLSSEDMYAFNSGALLESRLSIKTFDSDVKANSVGLYQKGIETTEGGFFNRQNRDTSRFEESENYHFAPKQALGQHQLKVGFNVGRSSYDGNQIFDPVEILGVSNRLVERIDFSAPARVNVDQNEISFFVQDKWTVWPRLTVDLGLRFDRDSIAEENNPAPRLGFAYLLTKDNRTVLRGGIGLFYDRVNLNIPTFLDLPTRTEVRFDPSGAVTDTWAYQHRLLGGIQNPRSLGWNFQLDRELVPNFFLRVGYQQRSTTRNFLLNPDRITEGDFLTLSNNGRDRYREFEATGRYRLGEKTHLTASYVRSSAVGDLNDFNSFFGNIAQAVIRPNERSLLPFNAPNRFLFWAEVQTRFKLTVSPVLDVHSGFPYSIVNEQLDFVGARNQAGRFPRFATFDLEVSRQIGLPFLGHKGRIGVRVFNVFNSFNPVDLQNNLASSRFGTFSNNRGTLLRGKFVIDF